ncbi:MAG: hypothetical protein JW910_23705 [Anaerolineae bacterium]|nr:hypothetical protein [Anaerolineae bacterium]
MKITETGLVIWTPEEVPPTGEETVVIEISDSSNEMTFHKFRVAVVQE